MKLTLHLFRKDLRQFRLLLLVWLAMLALDLAANMGWVGGIDGHWQQGRGGLASTMFGMQTFFLWVLFFLMPTVVVVTDSPARREGFLRTRPVRGRDLLLAKALFVLVAVILPALAQEWLYLTISGLPAGYVLHGVGERLLLALPLVTIAAAFASLWRSYGQWLGGLVLAYAGTFGVLLFGELGLYLAGHRDPDLGFSSAPYFSRNLAASYVFSLLAVGLAILNARYTWSLTRRWLGIATSIAIFLAVLQYWPWDLCPQRGADPAAAAAVVRQAPLNVSLQDLQLSPMFGKQWADRLDFSVTLNPPLNKAIRPNVIEWNGRRTALVNATGQSFAPAHPPGNATTRRGLGNSPASDLASVVGLLPQAVLFRIGQMYGLIEPSQLGEFKLASGPAWLREPVTLKADLDGAVYRWDKVAEFSLNAPASLPDAQGAWSFVGWNYDERIHLSYLIVKRSQISLATSADARLKGFEYSPTERYEFVLYDPKRNIAVTPGNSYNMPLAARGGASALAQYWMNLNIGEYGNYNWKPISPQEMADCRLLIFQKTWLGTVPATWQSPGFVINDLMTPLSPGFKNYQEGLSASEVEQRLSEIAPPDPTASPAEVKRYLLQALPIIDAGRLSQPPGPPVIARLAALVPDHLEILLDGLPAMAGNAKTAVIQAIGQGAEEAQKNQLIAAVPANPELIPILFQRGWVADARGSLDQLMNSPKPLSFEAMQAIAWFQDPQTYPSLLRGLQGTPRTDLYDLLRSLPGMADPLAASVAQLWADHDPVLSDNTWELQQTLKLALHAGNPDALRFALRLLDETAPKRGRPQDNDVLDEIFRNNVDLSGLQWNDRQNDQLILAKLRGHAPGEFTFDSIRQCFVLKSTQP
jgi:hypothetical protein